MARLIGLILMLVAIYYGVTTYVGGIERAPRDAETQPYAPDAESAERSRSGGRAAPSAITSRVRERVTNAVTEGARRHSGEPD